MVRLERRALIPECSSHREESQLQSSTCSVLLTEQSHRGSGAFTWEQPATGDGRTFAAIATERARIAA
jgi:hypothetical protein